MFSLPQTPTRRSQRFQPTATPVKQIDNSAILDCHWSGKPILVRQTLPEVDLLPEEIEELNTSEKRETETEDDEDQGRVDDEHQREDKFDPSIPSTTHETVFFASFRMKRRPQAYRGGKKLKPGQVNKYVTYRVGDTILVETDAGYIVRKPPSVGVIVAMWCVRKGRGLEEGTTSAEERNPNKMRVRIHWFLRPTEMAAIRAKREHEQNEIYYSLSTRVVISPGTILSPCRVSNNPTATQLPLLSKTPHPLPALNLTPALQKATKRRRGSRSPSSERETTSRASAGQKTYAKRSRTTAAGPTKSAASSSQAASTPRRSRFWDFVPTTPEDDEASDSSAPIAGPSSATRTNASIPQEDEDENPLLDNPSHPRPHAPQEEREEDSSYERFICRFAVDSRRGFFYAFDWDAHRRICMSAPIPTQASSSEEDGPSADVDPRWGEGKTWDVTESVIQDKKNQKDVEKTKAKDKGKGKGKQKQERTTNKEKNEGDAAEPDASSGSESESGASSDEYGLDSEEDDDEVEGELVPSDLEDGDDENGAMEMDDDPMNPRTPSKKRKQARRKKSALLQPTPHSKAALLRRKDRKRRKKGKENADPDPSAVPTSPSKRRATFAVRFPDQSLAFRAGMGHLPKDAWVRGLHALHVGSRPDALPCRDAEYERVLGCIAELLEEGSGGCVYISGVPGTGKTATVHAVVRELRRMAESSEINPFTYVEINGLKIPDPATAYTLLWEGISGHDVEKEGHLRASSKESLKALTRHFTNGNRGPEGHACVVLMDELDQLVTPKQDVIYNFFNWPTLAGSKLVVIAVANTMDLPERVMTGRVRSRLGMIRINFQPYTREQLEKIVEARIASSLEDLNESAKETIIASDAIKLAAMTVSRITGDARRVLDICRRAVELVQSTRTTAKAPQIREVVQVMQNSPTAAFLRDLSFHERLMLASLIKCIKREGVEEIKWSEVQYQHVTYIHSLSDENNSSRRPSDAELAMVLDSLVASRAVVLEDGPAIARKGDGERRMLLNLEQTEVERVLSDVGGQAWKNLLST